MKYIFDRLILLLIIAGLLYGGWWAFKYHTEVKREIELKKLKHNDKDYQKQIIQLEDKILKIKSTAVSERQIKNVVKDEMNKAVTNLISKNNEIISAYSVTTANTKQTVKLNPEIWKHFTNPENPESNYYFMKLYKTDKDNTKIPWAWVMYFPNRPQKTQWKYGIYPLKIKAKTVITKQQSGGTNSYTQLTVENNKDKNSKGKVQKFELDKNESFVQFVYPEKLKQFWFWNPTLELGVGTYYNVSNENWVTGGELTINVFNYGFKQMTTWKFMSLGLGSNFSDTHWVFVKPVEMNLQVLHVPLLHHLYFAPSVAYTNHGDWLAGVGLNLEF